jgi:hypothetical protein
MLRLIGVALLVLLMGSSIASTEDLKLPPLKRQSTPQPSSTSTWTRLTSATGTGSWRNIQRTINLICRMA